MTVANAFAFSANGARVRSRLGAFVRRRELHITSWPTLVRNGFGYEIVGDMFEAVQGAGLLEISNTFDFSGTVASQSIVHWSDAKIVFTFASAPFSANQMLWLRVTSDSGFYDTVITHVSCPTGTIDVTLNIFEVPVNFDSDWATDYCVNLYSDDGNQSTNAYDGIYIKDGTLAANGYGTLHDFCMNSPGFHVVGASSGQEITFGAATLYTGPSAAPGTAAVICSASPALMAAQFSTHIIAYYSFIRYAPGGTIPNPIHAYWTSGETVYFIPEFPVSLDIIAPTPASNVPRYATLTGTSFAEEGDISSSIAWSSSVDGALGTGASITTPLLTTGAHIITASITNAGGQQRSPTVSVTAVTLSIANSTANTGTSAGGTAVTINGNGFSNTTTVSFGGNPATSVVRTSITTITCVTPAHAVGAVDVVVTDGALSATKVNGFTYT